MTDGTPLANPVTPPLALDVAESVLLLDELADLLVDPPMRLGRSDLDYPHDSIGDPELRGSIARLLSGSWALEPAYRLREEHVLCTPGASAALRLHARVRLEPGDTVLIPAPYWQMFDRIYRDAGVSIAPLPIAPEARSTVELSQLQRVHGELAAAGSPPRLLLLTNPHNPLGIVESSASLRRVFDWVLTETDMEIVSDEIYAHSVVDPGARFVSAMALDASLRHPERVHAVWGFAKDFGLSGWMAGVLLTRSAELHGRIVRRHARFSPFDGLKNRVLKQLMCEPSAARPTPERLLQLFQTRLRAAHGAVTRALREAGIDLASSGHAAPFCWLDLRDFLDADFERALARDPGQSEPPPPVGVDPREDRLQRYLARRGGVVLLHGQKMHCPEPGFFRLCYSAAPAARITASIQAMGQALGDLR